MDNLENILEALLYLAGTPLQVKDIADKLQLPKEEILEAAQELKQKYSGASGVHLMLFNNKLQFASNPDYAESVAQVLNPIKEKELSNSMLEAVAIIAYKQPITRLEIEEIRGVNSDYAIQALSKHNMIEVVGRKDAIGKPVLFGTTDEFLKRFQLTSIDQLPDMESLLERIKIISTGGSSELYHRDEYAAHEIDIDSEVEIPESEELPEFLQDEEGVQRVEAEDAGGERGAAAASRQDTEQPSQPEQPPYEAEREDRTETTEEKSQ